MREKQVSEAQRQASVQMASVNFKVVGVEQMPLRPALLE